MQEYVARPFGLQQGPGGRYRWVVVALLFAACTINYIDRQMIGVLKPVLSKELGWSESDYGNIVFFFQLAYAIAYLAFGKLVDALGTRLGYAVAVVIWTVGHMAHGLATTAVQFSLARAGLGIGEAGGVLMNQAPHPLDLLCYLAGLPDRSGDCESSPLNPLVYPCSPCHPWFKPPWR